jgi:hypothetical protein
MQNAVKSAKDSLKRGDTAASPRPGITMIMLPTRAKTRPII